MREREERRRGKGRTSSARTFSTLAAIGLVLGACSGGEAGGADATTPATEQPTAAPAPPSGPFFLDLETGEMTPLAENLVGGYDYVASPDGTRLAYGTCCDEEDWITVANIDGTDAHPVTPTEGLDAYAPHWSPDGTKLVYQLLNAAVDPDAVDGEVGNLFVQDVSSERRTQLTDLELSRAWWWFLSPSFSPDGRKVIFQLPRDSSETTKWDVWSVPVAGGEPTLVLRNAAFPVYFPDGTEIAFVVPTPSNFGGHRISIAGADGQGPRRTLVDANSSIWWPTISPDGSRIAYQDGGSIYVVDVSTGESSNVADGNLAEWLDNDMLVVTPG